MQSLSRKIWLDLVAKRKQQLEEELSNAKRQETAKEAEKAGNSKNNWRTEKGNWTWYVIDEIWN